MSEQNIIGHEDFKKKLEKAIRFVRDDVPTVIGVEAVKHFKEAFRLGGLAGNKWAERKMPRLGGTNSQGVLTLSGNLMESIDYRINGLEVVIYSDLIYAEIHNEGGEITVTTKMRKFFWAKHYEAKEAGTPGIADIYKSCALAKKIKIEKRQFIGSDPALDNKIIDKITRGLDDIFNT